MLTIGLVGLGFMGRTHLENVLRLEREGAGIRVAALCDVDASRLNGGSTGGNIGPAGPDIDYSRFAKYTRVQDMLDQEKLDAVSITLPTFLHKDVAVQCLNRGVHVLCEKPMALSTAECEAMIEAAERSGKRLMIGQCLRFWPAYTYLKALLDEGRFGDVVSGYFYRCGGTPTWGAWLTQKEKSGGALLDMHVHDTDMIHWLFGKPLEVSALARTIIPGSGYDAVSTHYKYGDGKVINAQADWTMHGDFGFEMGFRVNFERGSAVFADGALRIYPQGAPGFAAELSPETGYYAQLNYFAEAIAADLPVAVATPHSTMGTIAIVEAEIESADRGGAWISVRP